MDESPRLFGNVVMGAQGLLKLGVQALGTGLSAMLGALQAGLSSLGQCHDGLTDGEESRFGLAYQAQEYPALATTLAPKTAHNLLEVLMKTVGLAL
jgi:hypothetical protein